MPNRLALETSPYLQQHANNPVDWYPWGEEALSRARDENKPILLSIGYSACHWCHVMAHESFEDPQVAAVMNAHFVNIKVDREERPDIDQIYQTAHQMLARRSGGWPLTMFLTPDQAPFFGGTYFPNTSNTARHNLPGFVPIMQRVLEAFRDKRAEIDAQNELILDALARADQAPTAAAPSALTRGLTRAPIEAAIKALAERFDATYGGFGSAPKFPHPAELDLCLRTFARTGDTQARHMTVHTLEAMARGGIFDHLGGGFCRYSTDARWMIPHFEKMLYDNGPLLALYTDAWRITQSAAFAQAVEQTAGWVMREMQAPEGGYFSSLDADSEGEEGKFYRWERDAVERLLTPREFALVAHYYGLIGAANFEGHHWHLTVVQPLADAATKARVASDDAAALLASARAKLFDLRSARVPPGRDEKILTSWNALAILGMARAAHAFGRPDWLASARRAMQFVRTTLWQNGRLLATYKDGRAHLNAYLDDYAFTLAALLELMQAAFEAFDPEDLAFACQIADALIDHFEDAASGGFFFTSHDHERLIHRNKVGHDNATPAGNAIAAQALQRLGHLTGVTRYLVAAQHALGAFHGSMTEHPQGFAAFLTVLEEAIDPTRVLVLRGAPTDLAGWRTALATTYHPNLITLAIPTACDPRSEILAKPTPLAGVNAYLCQGVSCLAPVDSVEALRAILGK